MRDLIIHDYDNVRNEVLWETIQMDLPERIEVLTPVVERQVQNERALDQGALDF